MAETHSGTPGGYVAFISYSHKDAAIGRWLHRKLEGYKVPGRLAGTRGEDGEVPARLIPIFRDREELPAAGDLGERVRAALAVSRNLIVICSPHSAASPWVAKEIATFREFHPDRPIFAAIVEGEPDQSFPPLLCEGGVEPLAADLRREGDGRRLGLLKLVAGLAGVGLDALVQRDASRRVRRVTYVTAAALAGMIVMALLTALALNARAEAQRQRAQAEGMVEFMLTDLRNELKGAASLRVLSKANSRALEYYQHQDLKGLAAESLERRARILQAMGEDDINRHLLKRARASFEEARATTARLLEEEPSSPERIFAQSQSEFWIGFVEHRGKNYAAARNAWERYRKYVERLLVIDPANRKWREEMGYAEGSLCTLALDAQMDREYAFRACTAALDNMRQAARGSRDPRMTGVIANRLGWAADAYRYRKDDGSAWRLRTTQEQMLKPLLAADPDNLDLIETWVNNQFSMAELEIARGEPAAARARLRLALPYAEKLTRADPANATWASRRRRILEDLAKAGG
ncbi:MAG TPA: toll/interleukin-1 receptor domain-containing protein [Allosphingosinicella sp.]|jgi:hypothetical protein